MWTAQDELSGSPSRVNGRRRGFDNPLQLPAGPGTGRRSAVAALRCVDMSQIIKPKLGRGVYIAPTAYVAGDVTLGDQVTVMHHVMIRGDIAPIRIGARVNVQDGTVVHTPHGVPLDIADDVGIGHRAVVHCRSIGPRTLIGIGAIVLDDCEIGSRCLIGAGSLLVPRTRIPDGSVVMGVPGQVVRQTSDRDLATIDHVLRSYLELGRQHAAGRFPNVAAGAGTGG